MHHRTAWTSKRWQLTTDIPLTAAACLFLVAYAYQVLAQPTGFPHRLTEWITVGDKARMRARTT